VNSASNHSHRPVQNRSISSQKKAELAERSLELHDKHVGSFVEFCDERGIENMNDLTARTVNEYRLEIGEDYQQSTVSIYLSTVRQFVQFCEGMNAVAPNVSERIVLPDRDRNACTEALEADEAKPILSYLRKYHYASRTHALMTLLWHTGVRTGTARGLDVEDLDSERDRLQIRHRPETDTPLKNAENAERYVALSEEVSDVLAAYIEEHRHNVTDDYDRVPLFTTNGNDQQRTPSGGISTPLRVHVRLVEIAPTERNQRRARRHSGRTTPVSVHRLFPDTLFAGVLSPTSCVKTFHSRPSATEWTYQRKCCQNTMTFGQKTRKRNNVGSS
jgi:site-specific recombinase XerD